MKVMSMAAALAAQLVPLLAFPASLNISVSLPLNQNSSIHPAPTLSNTSLSSTRAHLEMWDAIQYGLINHKYERDYTLWSIKLAYIPDPEGFGIYSYEFDLAEPPSKPLPAVSHIYRFATLPSSSSQAFKSLPWQQVATFGRVPDNLARFHWVEFRAPAVSLDDAIRISAAFCGYYTCHSTTPEQAQWYSEIQLVALKKRPTILTRKQLYYLSRSSTTDDAFLVGTQAGTWKMKMDGVWPNGYDMYGPEDEGTQSRE